MVAQMERRFIKDRQREGIEKAKAKGAYRGGVRRIDRAEVKLMHANGDGPSAVANALGCSRMQIYRILNQGSQRQ
jgi:DNA invertase Pin-like site-specific DNA recombinase